MTSSKSLRRKRGRGAVHLGVSAHPVVDARLERLSGFEIKPRFGGDVALFDEHVVWLAVLWLSGQELAALDDQDVQAGVPQGPGESTAAHTGANDHHICGQHFLIGIDKRALTERWWLSHDHAGTLGWVSNSSASVRLGIAARSPRR